jgi:hypothetical protein
MAQRTRVAVTPSARSNFKYGFLSGMDSADQTTLGQDPVVGGLAAGVVFGANSPKPAVMRKIQASGHSTSSFVSVAKRASAEAAGWKLVKPAKARRSSGGRFTKLVYVLFKVGAGASGINVQYAWRMPTTTYTAVGADRAALGIKDVSSTEDAFDLVYGSNTKPPKASKLTATGVVSTFVDPDSTLPDGWTLSGGEFDY